MEDSKFVARRREIMAENGDAISSIPLTEAEVQNSTLALQQIEIILGMIDQIIPPQQHPGRKLQPYSVQIRQYAEKLRESGQTDEEIYQLLLDHVEHHRALAIRLAQKGITSINLFFEPGSEFDT